MNYNIRSKKKAKSIFELLKETTSLLTLFALLFSNVLVSLPVTQAASDQLFYSGMESATYNDWESRDTDWGQSADDKICETKSASVKKTTGYGGLRANADIRTFGINTTGYTNLNLNFWYKIAQKIEGPYYYGDPGDHIYVQWSSNGSTWNTLYDYTNLPAGSWTYESLSLPSGAENKSNLKIRFRANLNSNDDEFRLDCVELTGELICTELTFYQDSDDDGYGNPEVTTEACSAPQGYVEDNTDCDDSDAEVYPGAQEVCDNKDNNCNGEVDEGLVKSSENQNGMCSGNTETCSAGEWIEDEGNYEPTDEVCEGQFDENCDGSVDEGCECIDEDTQPCGQTDVGLCEYGTQTCSGGEWGSCEGAIDPTEEICGNDLDEDCDGYDLPCPFITINAYKIVCQSETDLPNWGNGGPNITETTADDYVAQNPNCQLVSGWDFEWAYTGTSNPGDNIIGPAGSSWNTFGPTDSNGLATTDIYSLSGDRIWLREVMQEGYILFSGDTTFPRDNVSAEFYCHQDVLNYDNYDYILNPQWNNTYYCVGFNVPIEVEPILGCTDPEALNYNPEATEDDGSCEYEEEPVYGCTDPEALNYNPEATVDDESCQYEEPILGCTDPEALNYNPEATEDDGSCEYEEEPTPICGDQTCNGEETCSSCPEDCGTCPTPRRRGGYAVIPEGEVLGEAIEECGLYLFEYIKYGANNNPFEVTKLQLFLNEHMNSNLAITGVYDFATMNAVNQFQLQYKNEVLKPWVDVGSHCDVNEPTGYVFVTTQRWINLIKCPTLNLPMPDLSMYDKADCLAYLGEEVLGEEVEEEEVLPEGIPEEEELPQEEEGIPFEVQDTQAAAQVGEAGAAMSWLVRIMVVLLVAAVAWFIYKAMKK